MTNWQYWIIIILWVKQTVWVGNRSRLTEVTRGAELLLNPNTWWVAFAWFPITAPNCTKLAIHAFCNQESGPKVCTFLALRSQIRVWGVFFWLSCLDERASNLLLHFVFLSEVDLLFSQTFDFVSQGLKTTTQCSRCVMPPKLSICSKKDFPLVAVWISVERWCIGSF